MGGINYIYIYKLVIKWVKFITAWYIIDGINYRWLPIKNGDFLTFTIWVCLKMGYTPNEIAI